MIYTKKNCQVEKAVNFEFLKRWLTDFSCDFPTSRECQVHVNARMLQANPINRKLDRSKFHCQVALAEIGVKHRLVKKSNPLDDEVQASCVDLCWLDSKIMMV